MMMNLLEQQKQHEYILSEKLQQKMDLDKSKLKD